MQPSPSNDPAGSMCELGAEHLVMGREKVAWTWLSSLQCLDHSVQTSQRRRPVWDGTGSRAPRPGGSTEAPTCTRPSSSRCQQAENHIRWQSPLQIPTGLPRAMMLSSHTVPVGLCIDLPGLLKFSFTLCWAALICSQVWHMDIVTGADTK